MTVTGKQSPSLYLLSHPIFSPNLLRSGNEWELGGIWLPTKANPPQHQKSIASSSTNAFQIYQVSSPNPTVCAKSEKELVYT